MKVAFIDFWEGFEADNNFFLHCMRNMHDGVEVVSPGDADTIFFSCFGSENTKYTGVRKVFYTGEAQDYAHLNYDFSLSFDADSDTNARLPLWYLYIDWFGIEGYGNPNWLIPRGWLTSNNPNLYKAKKNALGAVFSNPVENRIVALTVFTKFYNMKAEVAGKCFGNPLQGAEKAKIELLSHYKWTMCFENTVKDGYVTEKYLHARACGSIPIYFGSNTVQDDFNFVGVNVNGSTLQEMRDAILEFDAERLKEPIIHNPDVSNAYKAIRRAIS